MTETHPNQALEGAPPLTPRARRTGRAAETVAWAEAGAWAALGAAACACVIGLEPNLVEEGLVVHFAQRLAAGEHLYRDMAFFTGPLPFELLGLLFRVFGEEIAVGRWTMVAIHGVATGTTYALARRAGAGPLAHAAAGTVAVTPLLLFPSFSMFYYTPLAFYLGTLGAYATLRGLASARWAFAAGLLVAAVALCKQTLGVALAASLMGVTLACAPAGRRLAPTRAFVLGGVMVTFVTLAVYGARGDLTELWRHLVVVPLSLTESYRSPFINLWPPGVLAEEIRASLPVYLPHLYVLKHKIFVVPSALAVACFQFLYTLPFVALVATLGTRWRGPLPAAVWCNAALLLAMTCNLFPRSDWGHLAIPLPAAAVQLCLLLGTAPPLRIRPGRPAWGVAGVLLAATAYSGDHVNLWLKDVAGPPTWGPRVPLNPVSDATRNPSLPRVITYLRQRVEPGEPIFVARSEPLVYFATDTTNPTRYSGVLTTLHEQQEREILAALEGVRFVVMSEIDQPLWTYYSDELPRVQKYLERHFRIAPYFRSDDQSWAVVLARTEDRGETLIDLIDERASARAWIRERPGEERADEEPLPKLRARGNYRALPMRVGPFGGGIDFDIVVPRNARFDAGVGMPVMHSIAGMHVHPHRSRMVVSLGRDGEFEELASHRVEDRPFSVGRWDPLIADLAEYAGQPVTLRLELVPEVRFREPLLSWWGGPRVARRPDADPPHYP